MNRLQRFHPSVDLDFIISISYLNFLINAFIVLLKQKVLLVDDSDIICKRISAIVCELSFVEVVGQATDGEQAHDKITHLKPDVVLFDINIPGSSGFDILVWMRQSSQDITVIMISNHSQKEYRDKAFSLGANYFLDKSSEFEKLPQLLTTINTAHIF